MLRVTDAQPLEGHRLRVTFSDGLVRDVDCSFLLRGTLGEVLRDPGYFRRVSVDAEAGTVVWPNGLDPAPEVLRDAPDAAVASGPLAGRFAGSGMAARLAEDRRRESG